MIWGKTDSEKFRRKIAKEKKWLAWYPVHLANGRWAWLEYVSCRYCISYDGSYRYYEYKLIKKGES